MIGAASCDLSSSESAAAEDEAEDMSGGGAAAAAAEGAEELLRLSNEGVSAGGVARLKENISSRCGSEDNKSEKPLTIMLRQWQRWSVAASPVLSHSDRNRDSRPRQSIRRLQMTS
jgi:hypothetical protein